MKFSSIHKKMLKISMVSLALLLLMANLGFQSSSQTALAQAGSPPLEPAAPGSSGPVTCTISYLFVYSTTVRFQCTQPVIGTVIWSYGISTAGGSGQTANRVLALLTMAYSLGKPVTVYYFDDTTLNPPYCYASTCRTLDFLYIAP